MEENDVIKEENKKGSYITGIIGGLIGGAVATIPWVVMYVQCNMILSLLAIVIALGTLKGYQLFKGKVTKLLKPIVIVITLLMVVVATLVVIPNWLAVKNGVDVQELYNYDKFMSALMQDLAVSVIFAILGISVAIANINKVLAENGFQSEKEKEMMEKAGELRKLQVDNKLKPSEQEEIDSVRKIFEELQAYDTTSAASKEKIIPEIKSSNPEKTFKKFLNKRVIKKTGDKYYYVKENEVLLVNKSTSIIIWMIVIAVICSTIAGMNQNNDTNSNNNYVNRSTSSKLANSKKDYKFASGSFKLKIPGDWKDEDTDSASTTYLVSSTGSADMLIIETDKNLDGRTLEEHSNVTDNYISILYKLPEADKTEECTIAGFKGYKTSYDTVMSGYKVKLNSYAIETDKYFVSIYTATRASDAEKSNKIFNEILDSLEEIK